MIPNWIAKLLGPHWRTSLWGLIAGCAAVVAGNPGDFVHWPLVVHIAQFVAGGGVVALGLQAQDKGQPKP